MVAYTEQSQRAEEEQRSQDSPGFSSISQGVGYLEAEDGPTTGARRQWWGCPTAGQLLPSAGRAPSASHQQPPGVCCAGTITSPHHSKHLLSNSPCFQESLDSGLLFPECFVILPFVIKLPLCCLSNNSFHYSLLFTLNSWAGEEISQTFK